MTTLLLTRYQANALACAINVDKQGGLHKRGQRWEHSFMGRWFAPATIDALVIAGLLRRVGSKRVRITDRGRSAHAADLERSQGRATPADAKSLKQFVADAHEPAPEITHNADGSIEFTCAGCGAQVFAAVDDGFGFPACIECRWFDEHPQAHKPEMRA